MKLNFKTNPSGHCVFDITKEMRYLFTCNITYLFANFETPFPGNKIALFEMYFYN